MADGKGVFEERVIFMVAKRKNQPILEGLEQHGRC